MTMGPGAKEGPAEEAVVSPFPPISTRVLPDRARVL